MKRWVLIGLSLIMLSATWLRLDGLGLAAMGHTEIYVPNIDLPDDYGDPQSRLTLPNTVTNSMWEPHPPGWYVLMWFWTKVAGTGLFAIRLPSVIFGVLSVLLLFAFGRLSSDASTALIAAALLALNGHQILWSQIARPATFVCFLGLLSCILLFLATRSQASIRRSAWLYMAVVLSGLASEHIFWILLAAQMAFCLVNIRERKSVHMTMFASQLLVVVVAAPLVTLAAFQSGRNHLGQDVLAFTRAFLQFGFLFESGSWEPGHWVTGVKPLMAPLGGALLLAGLLSSGRRAQRSTASEWTGPGTGAFSVAAVFSCIAILLAAQILGNYLPAKRAAMSATAAVPAVALLLGLLLKSRAAWIAEAGLRLQRMRLLPAQPVRLMSFMALAPFTLTVCLSLLIPLLASRQLLVMVPYLLLIMAKGMTSIYRAPARFWPVPLFAVLVVGVLLTHMASIGENKRRPRSPHDYEELAHRWETQLQESDVILVEDHLRTTPLFYYMKLRDYDFVGLDYSAEVTRRKPSRIWVFVIEGLPENPAIESALANYERRPSADVESSVLLTPPSRIGATPEWGRLRAELYVRQSPKEP